MININGLLKELQLKAKNMQEKQNKTINRGHKKGFLYCLFTDSKGEEERWWKLTYSLVMITDDVHKRWDKTVLVPVCTSWHELDACDAYSDLGLIYAVNTF